MVRLLHRIAREQAFVDDDRLLHPVDALSGRFIRDAELGQVADANRRRSELSRLAQQKASRVAARGQRAGDGVVGNT